jgi:hypothetical protein
MLAALTDLHQKQSDGIRNDQIQLSAQLYLTTPTFGAYKPGEEPTFVTGLGPHCFGLPNPPQPFKIPGNFRCVNDGAALTDSACGQAAKTSAVDQQAVGSPQENSLVKSILATADGTTPDKVPDVATMLIAPSLRGQEVTVK